MHRVRLIHWKLEELAERAERLRQAGFEVDAAPLDAQSMRKLREAPPAAVVIDLGRLPSQGGDLGVSLHTARATRHLPLVFVAGVPEKVGRIRDLLPDAVYTQWDEIDTALEKAVAHPPENPVVPDSVFARYAGASLIKKLGIKENTVVALAGAPEGFEAVLGDLPPGAVCRRDPALLRDLTLFFPDSQEEMKRQVAAMGAHAEKGGLWVVWPKKSAGRRTSPSPWYGTSAWPPAWWISRWPPSMRSGPGSASPSGNLNPADWILQHQPHFLPEGLIRD